MRLQQHNTRENGPKSIRKIVFLCKVSIWHFLQKWMIMLVGNEDSEMSLTGQQQQHACTLELHIYYIYLAHLYQSQSFRYQKRTKNGKPTHQKRPLISFM